MSEKLKINDPKLRFKHSESIQYDRRDILFLMKLEKKIEHLRNFTILFSLNVSGDVPKILNIYQNSEHFGLFCIDKVQDYISVPHEERLLSRMHMYLKSKRKNFPWISAYKGDFLYLVRDKKIPHEDRKLIKKIYFGEIPHMAYLEYDQEYLSKKLSLD